MRGSLPLALATATALFAAAPASARPVVTPVAEFVDSADLRRDGERFRHVGSGYVFPSSLGDMPARKVTIFGPGDVAAEYTVKGGAADDAWVDIYAYPAADDLTVAEATADVLTRTAAAIAAVNLGPLPPAR